MKKERKTHFQTKPSWSKAELDGWKQYAQSFNNKHTPMTSIWDRDEIANANEDSSSKFLNKALGDGDTIKVQFVDLQKEDLPEDTAEQYRTPDMKKWVLYFVDEEGKERVMDQKSTKSKLLVAMKAASIEPEQWIWIKRNGLEIETSYEVALAADSAQPPAPTKTDAPPF